MRHVKIEHGGEESTYRLLAIMRPLELGEDDLSGCKSSLEEHESLGNMKHARYLMYRLALS